MKWLSPLLRSASQLATLPTFDVCPSPSNAPPLLLPPECAQLSSLGTVPRPCLTPNGLWEAWPGLACTPYGQLDTELLDVGLIIPL